MTDLQRSSYVFSNMTKNHAENGTDMNELFWDYPLAKNESNFSSIASNNSTPQEAVNSFYFYEVRQVLNFTIAISLQTLQLYFYYFIDIVDDCSRSHCRSENACPEIGAELRKRKGAGVRFSHLKRSSTKFITRKFCLFRGLVYITPHPPTPTNRAHPQAIENFSFSVLGEKNEEAQNRITSTLPTN